MNHGFGSRGKPTLAEAMGPIDPVLGNVTIDAASFAYGGPWISFRFEKNPRLAEMPIGPVVVDAIGSGCSSGEGAMRDNGALAEAKNASLGKRVLGNARWRQSQRRRAHSAGRALALRHILPLPDHAVLTKQVADGSSPVKSSPAQGARVRTMTTSVVGLSVLFGLLYFVQGIVEPTEGLLSQPTKSLLRRWEHSASSAAWFAAILSLPWAIKPLYGLLTDFRPLGGSRRRSYLLLTTSVAFVGMTALYFLPLDPTMALPLLLCLLVPAFAIAFSDVVVDALMVEVGQPRGLTGQLQSIQWASLYAATIFTGIVGGTLSQTGQQQLGFLIAGLSCGASLLAVWLLVREPERSPAQSASEHAAKPSQMLYELRTTFRQRDILAIGAFLFLWNFNPFSATVLYYYSTSTLEFSEQFVGTLTSWQAVGGVIGCVGYGIICRRISVPWLIHGSIVAGILATLTYWAYRDPTSSVIVSVLVGVVYAIGTIIQLDLAARVCRPETAGTTFALLMSLSNLSVALAQGLGGTIYATLTDRWGAGAAFHGLVAVGALFTATCWLLAPHLTRAIASHGRSA